MDLAKEAFGGVEEGERRFGITFLNDEKVIVSNSSAGRRPPDVTDLPAIADALESAGVLEGAYVVGEHERWLYQGGKWEQVR
jgi:hypothetical protein